MSGTQPRNQDKKRRKWVIPTVAVFGATALTAGLSLTAAAEPEPNSPWPDDYEHPSAVRLVSQLTGAKGRTNTLADWAIGGTDLGLMWDNGSGEILMAVGDTFGNWSGAGGGGGDWRSNAVLRSSNADWRDGLVFDSAASDVPNRAKEVIPSMKVSGTEMTTIPTGAIAVDGRQYMSFMSVNHWGEPGEWFTNYSRIAYSDDNGENWNYTDGPQWDNDSEWGHKFQMVAFAHGRGDGYVYMFGTENGRFGPLHVSRVAEDSMLDKSAYTYWDGSGWVDDDAAAAPIVPAPVTELSVQYNTYLDKWMMMYTTDSEEEGIYELVFRTADSPQGPWSDTTAVGTSVDLPGLYAPYLHPWNEGPEVHFTMSLWGPYNVFQYAFTLDPEGNVVNPNLIQDPTFSRSEVGNMFPAWGCNGNCGIDHRAAWAYGSEKQAWMRHNSGWIDVYQEVKVEPHTRYMLTAFVTTGESQSFGPVTGEVGVRGIGPGAGVLAKTEFEKPTSYTKQQVEFDSGTQTTVEVYVGSTLNGDRWIQTSSLSLVKVGEGDLPVVSQIEEPVLIPAEECDVEATVSIPQDQVSHRYESSREGTTITVTAAAESGYLLADEVTKTWSFDVSATACEPGDVAVTPVAPTRVTQPTCAAPEGSVTNPVVEGLEYTQTRDGNVITVTASALEGFVVVEGATSGWEFVMTPAEGCEQKPGKEQGLAATGLSASTMLLGLLGLGLLGGGAAVLVARRRRSAD